MLVLVRKIVQRPLARQDLLNIWQNSFEVWGKEQANAYLLGLQDMLQKTAEIPSLGMSADHVLDGVFKRPYRHHMIFYRYTDDTLLVMRVARERMDVTPKSF